YSLNYPLRTNMVVQNPLEMRMIKQDELSEEKYLSTKITDARNFFGGLGYKKELFKSWCMNNFVAQFIMYSIPFIGEKMQEAVSNSADKITQIRENPLYVVLEKYTPK
ncbi:MAG: hypothetical protein KKF95_03005, partial [Nanoarchaeota archaeon]|nr:hypothetical protein [Nanoarchaeota archaeon]